MDGKASSSIWRGLAAGAGALALAVLAACGGGGGGGSDTTGSTGGNTGGNTGGTTTGTTSAAYTQGPIQGFGSIIVNGVRYDDSGASIVDDDGKSRSSSELRLGQVVQIDSSSVDRTALTATAQRVRLGIEIVGPISAIDTAAGTVTVLGQVIEIDSSTVFDDSLAGGLTKLAVGQVIEAHGLPDATTGHLVATRVESESGATAFRLRGTVAELNTTAKTFKLGTQLVSYADLTTAQVPSNLANGIVVKVSVKTTQVAGAWVATSLRTPSSPSSDASEVHVKGVITVFTSASSFEINGLKVDASGASYPGGSAGIGLGVRVEVEGRMVSGGLVASKIEYEGRHGGVGKGFEVRGTIDAVNTSAKTFTVRNVTISWSDSTVFKDGAAANLTVGRRVEVKGALSLDRTALAATQIEFK